jgi:hypothetical protein
VATYHIYCDESSTDKHNDFMVFGGIMLEIGAAAQYRREMAVWRAGRRMTSELKWTKVTNNKLVEYTDFVATALEKIKEGPFAFHAMVLEKRLIDYRRYHRGDEELGYHKFWYQFLFNKFCKRLEAGDRVTIFPDHRHTGYSFDDLRDVLNTSLMSKCGLVGEPVRTIQPICSKSSELMQINDVLMGAIGFHYNGREKRSIARQAKVDIATQVAAAMKIRTLKCETTRCMGRFSIWQFRLSA